MLFQAILFGAIMLVLAVLIHSWGTAMLVRVLRLKPGLAHRFFGSYSGVVILSGIAVFLLCLHMLQIALWAGVFWWLVEIPAITTFVDSFYFSMITYTTVGYGDIVVPVGEGRLLSGFASINGILLFGWSTALLFMTVEKLWFIKD